MLKQVRLDKAKRANLFILFLISVFYVLGFVLYLPAHAYTPNVANIGTGDWASGSSFTGTVTVNAVGDTIAIFIGWRCQTANCFNSVTNVASPGVSSFTVDDSVFNLCYGNTTDGECGGVIGQNWNSQEVLATGVANTTGSVVVTITLNSNSLASGGAILYDAQYVNPSPAVGQINCPVIVAKPCTVPYYSPVSSGGGQLNLAGTVAWSVVIGTVNGCGYSHPTGTQFAGAWFAGGITCGFDLTGHSGFETGYALIGAVFGGTAGTVTTTINQDCIGACSGGRGSGSYLLTNYVYLYYGQAILSPNGETVYNFTTAVTASHINAASGAFYMAIYVGNTRPPSATNPLGLVYASTITVFNNTLPVYYKTAPNTAVCSQCWYAIAVMATTTASRGSGASGSGISVAQTSAAVTLYDYNVGSPSLPNSIYSATTVTPNLFIVAYLKFSAVLITTSATLTGVTTLPNGTVITTTTVVQPASTVTSTVTVSGVVTSTSTTVLTLTSLASATNLIGVVGNLPILLLFLICPLAVFIGLGARTGNGGAMLAMTLVGVSVDIGIMTVVGLLPFYFVILLALTLVLALVMALRSGGGGGG